MDNIHILIVEDEEKLARLYSKTLAHAHFQVEIAVSVSETFDRLQTFDPDILCLDWQLGGETAAIILEHINHLPLSKRPEIALVSGQYEHIDLTPYNHLIHIATPKPITIQRLVTIVKEMANKAKLRQRYFEIHIEAPAPDALHIIWRGRIQPDDMQQMMTQEMTPIKTLIFDILEMTASYEDLLHLNIATHLQLPHLERVYAVTPHTREPLVRHILSFLPVNVELVCFASRQEALNAL